jgi:hypothetical protein
VGAFRGQITIRMCDKLLLQLLLLLRGFRQWHRWVCCVGGCVGVGVGGKGRGAGVDRPPWNDHADRVGD